MSEMDQKNFLRSSLVIKRIPSWINETTRVKVRQINEREVVQSSMVGLSVFRDSIYERKQKKIKPKVKSKMREKLNFSIRNVSSLREKKSKTKLKKRLEDGNAFCDYKSSIDSDPDYIASDMDYSCSNSDGTANRIHTKKKFHKLNSISRKSQFKNDLSSSSSEDNEELIQRSKFKNFLKRKKIIRRKEVNRKFFTLAPVVNKYESKKEMTARHKQMLIEAQKAYDKVVQKIKEEEKLMQLQLSTTYEKHISRNLENSEELFISVSSYDDKQYLCPLYFCSVFSTSPNKHLLEVHTDIITDEDRDIYLKAVKIVRRNFISGIDKS